MNDWRAWPALSRLGSKRHWRIIAEQAVLGFVHGAPERGRRAMSPGFSEGWLDEIALLHDAAPSGPGLFWQRSGSRSTAGAMTARADGPEARSDVWLLCHDDVVGVPSALLALVLLERVQTLARGALDAGGVATPSAASALDMSVREALAAERIAAGCQALAQAMGLDELSEVYAALLAGNRNVALPASVAALSGAGCAALLLPLDPELADGLGLYTRSPARATEVAARQRFAGSGPQLLGPAPTGPLALPRDYAPSAAQAAMARSMAEAVLRNDPSRARRGAAGSSG